MTSAIATFKAGWVHTRGMTFDFIAAVPEDRWEYSPHPRFAPLHKQIRHLVCVQGVYIDGIRTLGGFETPPSWKMNWGL